MGFLNEVFRTHGRFCARHPWEVIFVVLTSTVCIISKGMHHSSSGNTSQEKIQPQALDIILMTLVRSVAVLYSYHRLRSLHRSHSRFVLGTCKNALLICASFKHVTLVHFRFSRSLYGLLQFCLYLQRSKFAAE